MENPEEDPSAPVLVVVLNRPADLARAQQQGWYRVPLATAPPRVAADYLAFYQTGAFAPEERWSVRWLAPVRGYHISTRAELIPEEPDHPRARERYYKISLGPLTPLHHPIPSRRLRRIAFITTTLGRLDTAEEINDLWIKSSAQERLWAALKQAGIEAECQYPVREDLPEHVADFALPCRRGKVALIIEDEPAADSRVRDAVGSIANYLLEADGWTVMRGTADQIDADPAGWVAQLAALARELGGVL